MYNGHPTVAKTINQSSKVIPFRPTRLAHNRNAVLSVAHAIGTLEYVSDREAFRRRKTCL